MAQTYAPPLLAECPTSPVLKGQIQGRALGVDLHAYSDEGHRVSNSLGEMVIEKPMPSMPIYFWGDKNNERYRESYFNQFEGKWCHGDWLKIDNNGQITIQGRSDATLNRKGIRMGTAEIYSILDKIVEISDSLIINLELENGEDFMPLFVVLDANVEISDLKPIIIHNLKTQGSPRHVPDAIIAVPEIPYTLSGKKMEVPVKKILMKINNQGIKPEATRNPDALVFFGSLNLNELMQR